MIFPMLRVLIAQRSNMWRPAVSTVQLHMGQVINFWQGLSTVQKVVVSSTPHPYTASQYRGYGQAVAGIPRNFQGDHTHGVCLLSVIYLPVIPGLHPLGSGGLDPLTNFYPLISLGEVCKPSCRLACRTKGGLYCPTTALSSLMILSKFLGI